MVGAPVATSESLCSVKQVQRETVPAVLISLLPLSGREDSKTSEVVFEANANKLNFPLDRHEGALSNYHFREK